MEAQPYGPFAYVPVHDRPPITWPNGARVALWVIPNIEFFALDETTPGGSGNVPDVSAWSKRDYGNRVGIFRMMEVMEKHGVRGTVALNADVCDHHPQIIEAAGALDWEFMGHCRTNTQRLC
ncbi:MAG: polysaccharide deacetylase, partial [Alphaproteobacteria bacterium]